MQGEFRGDFTRDTHNPGKQFLRVFMQQGRVQLDADWNEQVSILLNYIQTLATDLIGPYGGPKNNCGFEVILPAQIIGDNESSTFLNNHQYLSELQKEQLSQLRNRLKEQTNLQKNNFLIGSGHYYVQGKLCQNQNFVLYSDLPDYPFSNSQENLGDGNHLVYLDVWERHISFVEDASDLTPSIREIALGKADTTTRSQLVWQVKVKPISQPEDLNGFIDGLKKDPGQLKKVLEEEPNRQKLKPGTGLLQVRAKVPSGADASDPCAIAPESRYRGAENQLYRVEIHDPGEAGKATFKWSRENGSVIFPVEEVNENKITVSHFGWDDRFGLKKDDWVELVDDHYTLLGRAEPLRQVSTVDPVEMVVTLKTEKTDSSYTINKNAHPLLRRWDQQETNDLKLMGSVTIVLEAEQWVELENGIEVQFISNKDTYYATGDYWLIPARVATGDVEWPQIGKGLPASVPPHGVEHYYAPLWIIADEGGDDTDCRCKFPSLCELEEA